MRSQISARDSGPARWWAQSRNSTRGPVQQRRGQVQAALHAAGEGLDAPVDGVGQADQLGHLDDLVAQDLALEAVQLALEGEQLAAGLLGVEAGLLEGDPDEAPHRGRP